MKRTKRDQDMKGYRYRRKHSGRGWIPAGVVMLACLLTSLPLIGCGEAAQTGADEIIELHEPGTGTVTTERAAVRSLYDAVVYEGAVYPHIEEYSFETEQFSRSYVALPGGEVRKGDVLFTARGEKTYALDEQIKSMQEQVNELTREHEKYLKRQEEDLYIKRCELEQLKQILNNLEAQKPKETILDEESGQEVANPGYDQWLKGANGYQEWYGKYSLKDHEITVGENDMQQKKELYALDYGYYNGILNDLKKEKSKEVVTSGISGKVMGMQIYWRSDSISAGEAVMAVGNEEELVLKCDYVHGTMVETARDVYALIRGERYEVTYLESKFRNAYSSTTFSIQDEDGRVEAGDYAVLVLVLDSRKDVLTVPAQSVYREGSDRFVHIVEDGVTVSRKVETGMSDGVYIEILSGLEEGDRVVAQIQEAGKKTTVLEKSDIWTEYRGAGSLFYPLVSYVSNTVKNGTVRYVEYKVVEASYVEKGDVIAVIQVEGDSADLTRREREVQRAKERLADLEADLDMTKEENAERIAEGQESIRKQEEEIRKIRSDYATTEIRAEVSGYVSYLVSHSPGDWLQPGETMGTIMEDSAVYMLLGNSDGKLNYGDVVDITYPDMEGKESIAQGKVLTIGNIGLPSSLWADWAIVGLPREMLENMQATEKRMYTTTFRTMAVTGICREAGEAVKVPVDAVIKRNGRTYVNVLEEDGSVMPRGFLAGGKNDEYYWVIDGLTEGMKICWE